jgi:hypothetical protein
MSDESMASGDMNPPADVTRAMLLADRGANRRLFVMFFDARDAVDAAEARIESMGDEIPADVHGERSPWTSTKSSSSRACSRALEEAARDQLVDRSVLDRRSQDRGQQVRDLASIRRVGEGVLETAPHGVLDLLLRAAEPVSGPGEREDQRLTTDAE